MTPDVNDQKDNFRRLLEECRAETEAVLMGADPERVVYDESGWRVKDLIAHLTSWEREVITSIRAYNDNAIYSIADFSSDDSYNEKVFRRDYDVPFQQLQMDWTAVHARFISAILSIPAERWDGQIMCPWHLTSSIEGIVRDMINHEAGHRHDIRSKVD